MYRNNETYFEFAKEIEWYDTYLNSNINKEVKLEKNNYLKEKCNSIDLEYKNMSGENFLACDVFDISEKIIENEYKLGRDLPSFLMGYHYSPPILELKINQAYRLWELQNLIRKSNELSEKMKLQNEYKLLKENYDMHVEKERKDTELSKIIYDFYLIFDNLEFIVDIKIKEYFIVNNIVK